MKLFKNYKKLYQAELQNRKLFEERYKQLKAQDEEWQKNNIANLRLEIRALKENVTRLTFDLEDTTGFLNQEKECNNALREKIEKLKKKNRNLKMKVSEEQVQSTAKAIKDIADEQNIPIAELIDTCIYEGDKVENGK